MQAQKKVFVELPVRSRLFQQVQPQRQLGLLGFFPKVERSRFALSSNNDLSNDLEKTTAVKVSNINEKENVPIDLSQDGSMAVSPLGLNNVPSIFTQDIRRLSESTDTLSTEAIICDTVARLPVRYDGGQPSAMETPQETARKRNAPQDDDEDDNDGGDGDDNDSNYNPHSDVDSDDGGGKPSAVPSVSFVPFHKKHKTECNALQDASNEINDDGDGESCAVSRISIDVKTPVQAHEGSYALSRGHSVLFTHTARARVIAHDHMREYIEKNGIEAAKTAGFRRYVTEKNRMYPSDGWHKDARELADKILGDKDFIRLCQDNGLSPEKVVNAQWFYRLVKKAEDDMDISQKAITYTARALLVAHDHMREYIEKNGIEAAKTAGFKRNVYPRYMYPSDDWHKDAREIADKILGDEDFIRLCQDSGRSPEKVVNANWFYRLVRKAEDTMEQDTMDISETAKKPTKKIDKKHGLFLEFEDVELAGRLFETVRINGDDIPGHFEHFEEKEARDIATRHVTWVLKKFCDLEDEVIRAKKESLEDILGGIKVHDLFEVLYGRLEQIARRGSANQKRELNPREEDMIGNLSFATLANIKVFYCDLVSALTNRTCGVIDRKDGNGLCFPTKLGKLEGQSVLLKRQNCIGSVVRAGRDPNDFQRPLHLDNYYIIDQFGMPSLYDLNPVVDACSGDKYKKVPLGRTGRYIRCLKFNTTSSATLVTFTVNIHVVDESRNDHNISVHRLLQLNAQNLGMGIGNNAELKAYLDDKTLEEAFPYVGVDQRKYERKLKRKGWIGVEFAKLCDVDHLVGRMELWMNMTIFTMPCSHRWNTCMRYIRQAARHWCFALGFKSYTGGN